MKCKALTAIVFSIICLGSSSLAAEYSCSAKDHGYSHSTRAATGNLAKQLDIVKSWIPANFTVNTQTIKFQGFPAINVSGGDRINSFQGFLKHDGPNSHYKIKINPHENSGTVLRNRNGYKPMGPVFFSCFERNS